MKNTRRVYVNTTLYFGPSNNFAPDLDLTAAQAPEGNGSQPKTFALVAVDMSDPNNAEAVMLILTDEGRENLVRMLTGGIVVPTPGQPIEGLQ